jgi:hypothetical protein
VRIHPKEMAKNYISLFVFMYACMPPTSKASTFGGIIG